MKRLIAAILTTSMLTGCYSLTYAPGYYPDGADITFTRKEDAKVVHRFDVEHRAVWIFAGGIPLSQPNVGEMIRREAMGAPVQGLKIRSEQSATDLLLTTAVGLTGFLLLYVAYSGQPNALVNSTLMSALLGPLMPQFRTVTVEGEVLEKPLVSPR